MPFKETLNNYQIKIESCLNNFLPKSNVPFSLVTDAARYSLLDAGKRLRPVLMLEFYRALGGKGDHAINFACALEMIHTYSLIHDDLPCMDNDDLRRGKPSCHKQFSEDIALLAGDTLLTKAFETASNTENIPSDRIVKATNLLSCYAGECGMIGGQVMDITGSAFTSKELTLKMYSLKTACLIKAATSIGAVLAGADDETLRNAEEYAENLGLAFQIIDDILDLEGDEAMLGKPVGSDDKNGKLTYTLRVGVDNARADAKLFTEKALSALDLIEGDTSFLKELTLYLLDRKY